MQSGKRHPDIPRGSHLMSLKRTTTLTALQYSTGHDDAASRSRRAFGRMSTK